MNPVLLFFLSGESLYYGAALLFIAVVASPLLRNRGLLRNILAWFALIIMVMAAPPFSWALVWTFALSFALWYWAWNSVRTNSRLKWSSALVLLGILLAAVAVEYPHRRLPTVSGPRGDHLTIIGDSISAGLNPALAWPVVLQETQGINVRNLAKVGATVSDANLMARDIHADDKLVLIEIGGNDMIAGASSAEFEKSLDLLLRSVSSPQRTVVMVELPLLPYRLAYGQVQRRLAKKYGVWLVPKRFFVEVIAGSDATSDGLHLTQAGARRMATLVARVFAPVLESLPHRG